MEDRAEALANIPDILYQNTMFVCVLSAFRAAGRQHASRDDSGDDETAAAETNKTRLCRGLRRLVSQTITSNRLRKNGGGGNCTRRPELPHSRCKIDGATWVGNRSIPRDANA